eukprot:SAG22_NODE_18612_length_284_cov_0.832432_1_plen_63_part_10
MPAGHKRPIRVFRASAKAGQAKVRKPFNAKWGDDDAAGGETGSSGAARSKPRGPKVKHAARRQ